MSDKQQKARVRLLLKNVLNIAKLQLATSKNFADFHDNRVEAMDYELAEKEIDSLAESMEAVK